MRCTVVAPKRAEVDLTLANGKQIKVPRGARADFELTGDEVGMVQAHICAKMKGPEDIVVDAEAFLEQLREEHGDAAGAVLCEEREAAVPPGSKKAKALEAAAAEAKRPAAKPGPPAPSKKDLAAGSTPAIPPPPSAKKP